MNGSPELHPESSSLRLDLLRKLSDAGYDTAFKLNNQGVPTDSQISIIETDSPHGYLAPLIKKIEKDCWELTSDRINDNHSEGFVLTTDGAIMYFKETNNKKSHYVNNPKPGIFTNENLKPEDYTKHPVVQALAMLAVSYSIETDS